MPQTTPAPERYTRFSCPHPQCPRFNRPGEGNIAHRSWTGTHKHSERRRCTACDRECSAREGTLMARSKLPEATVVRLAQCQRWGVCDEGTADICAVDLKTVHRFQHVAAQRAETHHRQVVHVGDVPGVHLDEAHAKLRPRHLAWIHTALAMGSWFLRWVDVGPRTPEMASTLIAQGVARTRAVPLFLTDGWQAYPAALLQVLGGVDRRRRRGTVGRKPTPRRAAPPPCSTRRASRCVIMPGVSATSADGWSSVVPAALASNCACGSSARRSRRPVWNGGMAHCAVWWRRCAAARGVCPGAVSATGNGSGSWAVSITS
jgi:hypothetical protein